MVTIRDLVKEAQVEIRDTGDLLPDRAAELQNRLTALLGNINDELRKADAAYRRVYLAALREHGTANRARIESEAGEEYERVREAKDTKDLTVEMIRSLRAYVRVKTEEMRLAR